MMSRRTLVLVFLIGMVGLMPYHTEIQAQDEYAKARAKMVRVIKKHAWYLDPKLGRRRLDESTLEVMGRLPRHLFVPDDLRRKAYADRPLPIGHGQTISQPFIVAFMTDLLDVEADHVVLEIGTGSGYQAAVLAELVAHVCTLEIIPELGRDAAARLATLGFRNVQAKVGDGYYGWPECGPFDAIIVTVAAGHIPPPLIEQLKTGGRMVIPVGGPFVTQRLVLIEKRADGRVTTRHLIPVRFVPLVSGRP